LVIDDSYNGNSDGVAEAIKVLSRFKNRRKIYITPGLVEIGKSSADIHRGIGKLLAGVADVVILIKNSVTPWIVEGLSSSGVILRPQCNSEAEESQTNGKEILRRSDALTAQDDAVSKKPQIIWFNSALEAHAGLKDILKPGDVILFQNDWGDQYL
jgi:UDP-N-acetylmuramoyl-tripeptide--D-alanyl-D-alanine ligase